MKTSEKISWQRSEVVRFEHAMEEVAELKGVIYINDSKSITPALTAQSINSINADLILILGGRDWNTDYSMLAGADLQKVKTLIYLGEKPEIIRGLFSKCSSGILHSSGIENAVRLAQHNARSGHIVLFSPAVASHDPFDNYKKTEESSSEN